MKHSLLIISLLALAGCATRYVPSHIQDYRPKGQDAPIAIQGAIQVDPAHISTQYGLWVRMDNVPRIALDLGTTGNGEISCKPGETNKYCSALDNHAIGASCMSSTNNGRVARINCTVFIDNERAATFTFN